MKAASGPLLRYHLSKNPKKGLKGMKQQNQRRNTILFLIVTAGVLILITAAGMLLKDQAVQTDLARKNLAPSREFLLGTDGMGRDMFARTLAGL